MNDRKPFVADLALLGTRVLVAGIFLWHGIPKAIDPALAMEKFAGFGLPGILGPVIGFAEVLAGLLLIGGLFTRRSAGVLAIIIVGAIVTVQIPAGVTAGLERDLLILVATAVLLTHGGGAAALDDVRGVGRRGSVDRRQGRDQRAGAIS